MSSAKPPLSLISRELLKLRKNSKPKTNISKKRDNFILTNVQPLPKVENASPQTSHFASRNSTSFEPLKYAIRKNTFDDLQKNFDFDAPLMNYNDKKTHSVVENTNDNWGTITKAVI